MKLLAVNMLQPVPFDKKIFFICLSERNNYSVFCVTITVALMHDLIASVLIVQCFSMQLSSTGKEHSDVFGPPGRPHAAPMHGHACFFHLAISMEGLRFLT